MSLKIEERKPTDAGNEPGEPLRWRATITYRKADGLISDVQTFEEIEDLHQIIEEGPNFYAIHEVVITVNPAFFQSRPTLKTYLGDPATDPRQASSITSQVKSR